MTQAQSNLKVPKNPAHRRAWVNYKLKLRGESFASLAREVGVVRQAISTAFLLPCAEIEEAIAAKLGLKAEQLFPERFSNGRRIYTVRGPHPNRSGRKSNAKERRTKI